MILNDFFECTDAISCNLLLCFTRALSFWTFAMCRGCPVCFLIVDRPTLPIYIGISKTKTKDIARQFARIHQWKQTGLPQHLKLWALLFSGWHISFSVMQKAASMAGVLELIFSPAVLVTFQGLIGNFAVFCHKFEHCWIYAFCSSGLSLACCLANSLHTGRKYKDLKRSAAYSQTAAFLWPA